MCTEPVGSTTRSGRIPVAWAAGADSAIALTATAIRSRLVFITVLLERYFLMMRMTVTFLNVAGPSRNEVSTRSGYAAVGAVPRGTGKNVVSVQGRLLQFNRENEMLAVLSWLSVT